MFEQICIKPTENTFPTDIGFIAENLLYYGKVNLIASTDTLPVLLDNCDVELLIELMNRGCLKIYMKGNILGTMSTKLSNGNTVNDVALITSDNHTVEELAYRSLFLHTQRTGYSRRTSKRLLDYIEPIKYDDGICDLIRTDLDNEKYVKDSIIDTIKLYNPHINIEPNEIQYKKIKTEKGFFFLTNLNFEEINKQIPHNPDGKLVDSTSFILNIQETRGDMYFSSSLGCEIATTPIQTQLMRLKFKDIYQKIHKSTDDIYQFNDFILNDGHSIKEVINSGERKFSDFIKLLDKAEKYKGWLLKVGEDQNLIKEYHKAVTKDTWVDKLPGKSLRWSFFTGLGLALDIAGAGGVGTAVGLGLSAGDSFLLDKVIKGWNPSVFVDNELNRFVNKK